MKIESKTLTSMDMLEHWAVIKFCWQETSPMETKRFLDAAGDDTHVSRTIVLQIEPEV